MLITNTQINKKEEEFGEKLEEKIEEERKKLKQKKNKLKRKKIEEQRKKFEEKRKKFESEKKQFEEERKFFWLSEEPIDQSASSVANISSCDGIMICWRKMIKHNSILTARICSKESKNVDQEETYQLRNNLGRIPISLFCVEFYEFKQNIKQIAQKEVISHEIIKAITKLNAALSNTFVSEKHTPDQSNCK